MAGDDDGGGSFSFGFSLFFSLSRFSRRAPLVAFSFTSAGGASSFGGGTVKDIFLLFCAAASAAAVAMDDGVLFTSMAEEVDFKPKLVFFRLSDRVTGRSEACYIQKKYNVNQWASA